ncbi:hypothetical protein ES703_125860 [subsurface metagenome]
MNKSKKQYDKKVKVTRILLSDYLVLKRMSQVAGVSMPEALHRLIEHQAQLPLLDMAAKPMPVTSVESMPVTSFMQRSTPVTRARSTPVITSFTREVATNGHR